MATPKKSASAPAKAPVQPATVAAIPPYALNQRQAAAFLGVKRWAIKQACWAGELVPARIGKCDVIAVDDLIAWFEKKKQAAA